MDNVEKTVNFQDILITAFVSVAIHWFMSNHLINVNALQGTLNSKTDAFKIKIFPQNRNQNWQKLFQ